MGKNYDFVKVIKWFAALLIFVVILNFGISFYSAANISNQTLQLSNQTFSKEVQEIDNTLKSIYSNMALEIAYDSDLDKMEEPISTLTTITGAKRIKNTLGEWSSMYKIPVNFVIYMPKSSTIIDSCKTEGEYDTWRKLKEDMLAYVLEEGGHIGWCIETIQGEDYLICVKRYNTRYIICWTKFSEVARIFTADNYGEQYYVVLSDMDNAPYMNADKLEADKIELTKFMGNTSTFNAIRGYIVLSEPVSEYFKINMLMKDYKHIFTLLKVQIILGVALLLIVVLIVWLMWMIYHTLVEPIKQFTNNVDHLMEDDTYTVATHYQINELGKASRLLADLVNKINKLKISIYENTLEQQKIKMDFLSLQIEPHFYLNCLNIIYNMAQMGKDKEIQQLSKCVSVYLRYIFRSGEKLVEFCEELEHTRNYIKIQEIRYKGKFQTNWQIDDCILESKIPPLVLQTFVENTLKHAMSWDYGTVILIRGYKEILNNKEKVVLIIEDNGEGFSEEILDKLQGKENISEGDKRIGVMNVIQRLHLIFHGEVEITFYNKETGGAGIKIVFPLIVEKKQGMEGEHESIIG